jgi:cytochrome b561
MRISRICITAMGTASLFVGPDANRDRIKNDPRCLHCTTLGDMPMTSLTVQPLTTPTAVRHDPLTIALHWITAFLVLAQFTSAHVWDFLEKGTFWRLGLIMTHFAFGILLAATVVVRIAWRLPKRDRLPPAVTGVQHLAATAVHMLLYCLLVAQIVLGFLFSWSSGKPLPFFDLFSIPVPITIDPSYRHTLAELHNDGAWAIIAVVGLHAAAALMHHYVLRDAVLLRMLPGRSAKVDG